MSLICKIYDGIPCRVIEGDEIKPYRGWRTHPWDFPPAFLQNKKELGLNMREMIAHYKILKAWALILYNCCLECGNFKRDCAKETCTKGYSGVVKLWVEFMIFQHVKRSLREQYTMLRK